MKNVSRYDFFLHLRFVLEITIFVLNTYLVKQKYKCNLGGRLVYKFNGYGIQDKKYNAFYAAFYVLNCDYLLY